MNLAIAPADIQKYVCGHLESVFDTMFALKVELAPTENAGELESTRLTGTVGMAGETVTGQVYLHLPATLGIQITATMLCLPAEELGDAEVNDVIGEATNMVAGGLKSWLCDAGATCALTTPAVIRGTSFSITPRPGVELILIPFTCQSVRCLAEVHVKFN